MDTEKRPPEEHVVKFSVKNGKFEYTGKMDCFCVYPEDTIRWQFKSRLPLLLVIKSLISPLDISCKIVEAGEEITARVKKHAVPGIYAYALATFDGKTLVADDPDIIIRPPDGRGH